jgi:hypothetical protein
MVVQKGAVMIITKESLDKLYKKNNQKTHFRYQGICHGCGWHVGVKITKTSGGFGLSGGVLYEPTPENFMIICSGCLEDGKRMSQKEIITEKSDCCA